MSADALRYGRVAMTLHWLIAALILLDFLLALSFSKFDPGSPFYLSFAYDQHMSVGMMALVLSVFRLGWRLLHRAPPLPAEMGAPLRLLARLSHAALYVFMLGAPLSGWVILSVRKRPPPFAGNLSWPNLQFLTDLDHPHRTVIHQAFLPGHIWFSYAGMTLVALHVLAALYHHYLKHDDVMRRMLPWARQQHGPEGIP
jgi:cytochrome b561